MWHKLYRQKGDSGDGYEVRVLCHNVGSGQLSEGRERARAETFPSNAHDVQLNSHNCRALASSQDSSLERRSLPCTTPDKAEPLYIAMTLNI